MTRIQLACIVLLASAFVLTGVLISSVQNKQLLNTADANMVVTRGPITALTARTRDGEECLFVLENTTQVLLIYRTDVAKNRVELVRALSLAEAFGLNQAPTVRPGATRTPR